MYNVFGSVNEIESHNKSRQYYLALEKFWVNQCGWLLLCTAVNMGISITSFWKTFLYGVKRDTMKNKLVSENSWKNLLLIDLKILFQLILGL